MSARTPPSQLQPVAGARDPSTIIERPQSGAKPRGGGDVTLPPAIIPRYGGGVAMNYTSPARNYTLGGTILDQVVPMVYGSQTVTGYIAFVVDNTTTWYIGIVFAYGEQASIGSLTFNGDSSPVWVTNLSTHVGDGSSALSALLTGSLDAGEQARWQSLCHCAFELTKATAPAGSLIVDAELGGRVITDFRDDSTGSSQNPALVAYDILTSPDWIGISSADIDADSTGTWADVANWCDEVQDDSLERFYYNARIIERDPYVAARSVLEHCFAEMYYDIRGRIKLWAEMLPPEGIGDWSASASATITEDATSGNAESDFAAGDWVIVGTTLAQISSITDDDTIVLDRAVTVSGVKVRKLSGVYIRKHNWVKPPTGKDVPLSQIPDTVIVRYSLYDERGGTQYPDPDDITDEKRAEVSMLGIRGALGAEHYATTYEQIHQQQPWTWSGVVDSVGVELEPGDIVVFDDDVLSEQMARVMPPVTWNHKSGTYSLVLQEFVPAAYAL